MTTTCVKLTYLREFRIAKVLTQRGLAERAHINKATVQSLESGEHLANFQTIHKLAAALGISPETLAWGEPPDVAA